MFRNSCILSIMFILSACIHINVDGPGSRQPPRLQEVVLDSEDAGSPCLSALTCGLIGGGARSKVLVIPFSGTIVETDEMYRNVTPGMIKRQLDLAVRDSRVRAVILKINSPGGAVGATDLIYRQLKLYSQKQNIPIYAHVDTIGASGAYYAAMATKRINARPTALVGSIGVILRTFGVVGLMEKMGVQYRSVKSSKNKDSLSPFTEMTKEDEEFYRAQILRSYERFLGIVLEARRDRLPEANLRRLADGHVYDAEIALKEGLIDSVEYFEPFYESIKKENNLTQASLIAYLPPGAEYTNIYEVTGSPDRQPSLEEILSSAYAQHRGGLLYLWDPGVY